MIANSLAGKIVVRKYFASSESGSCWLTLAAEAAR